MIKKIPGIPPLLINNEIISDFMMKTKHFNNFFAFHYTSIDNNSKVPANQTYIRDSKLSSLQWQIRHIYQDVEDI